MRKEELRNVDGSDSLHPNRSGDVVVVLKPPYQFDAATLGQSIAFSQFFGQHGYLPETVDFASGVNMHATFVAEGPGIRKQGSVSGVRAVDLAPTLSFLMGIPGPINARGKILYNLLKSPGQYKEATIIYITDFHGQLTPLSQAADNVTGSGTTNPTYGIGGAAYLKPWFDWYRAEAMGPSLTLTGGDAVGATPPISNFFGDTPTMTTDEHDGRERRYPGQPQLRSRFAVPAFDAHPIGSVPVPRGERCLSERDVSTGMEGIAGFQLPRLQAGRCRVHAA